MPEARLGSIPFEALPVSVKNNVADFKSIDYLINHHTISYALTAHSIINKTTYKGSGILGFTPTFKNESKLSALPFSQELSKEISAMYKGTFMYDKRATKNALFSKENTPRILQIATHFKINEDFPELTDMYCYDDEGNLSSVNPLEILDFPYIPELTILSGCQTGIGKSIGGEGSLSFGRYFMKLGSPSIVTTLWEVDDKASKDVLSLFYQYLAQGKSKNTALRQAKLDYIANLNEHQTANPINWAGYILIGNYDPIELDKKWLLWGISVWHYLSFLIVMSATVLYLKKH